MKVLIAIDDSSCSAYAVDTVVQRQWAEGAQFRLITVIEPSIAPCSMPETYMQALGEAQCAFKKYSRKLLDEKLKRMEQALPHAEITAAMLEGNAASVIIEEAKRWQADLVIVGSHGRSGFEKLLLGSVAERVACHAPCSVEIVKQKATVQKGFDVAAEGAAVPTKG